MFRSSPPFPLSQGEGASWKGDRGQILIPCPSHTLLFGDFSQGEGASWKGDRGLFLLGYYSVSGVLVMFYYWVIIR